MLLNVWQAPIEQLTAKQKAVRNNETSNNNHTMHTVKAKLYIYTSNYIYTYLDIYYVVQSSVMVILAK